VELTFVCMGKESVSVESSNYFLDMGFVFGNVIRINEDVIHKLLESCGCISKPFRHYHPLKETITGLENSLPFVSSGKLNKMICMSEADFGIDSCFSWTIYEVRCEWKWVTVFL